MTDTDTELLTRYAHASHIPGQWYFGSYDGYTHSTKDTLKIIKACLFLDVNVTDTVTTEAWFALVSKIANLENRGIQ